jgi:hypothetical protein
MEPTELERLVDRELRKLPAPRAPRSLLPRVIAAAEQRANRPWYARAWVTWPVAWQVASVALLFALAGGAAMLLPRIQDAAAALTFVDRIGGDVSARAREVEVVTTAAGVVWRALLAPVVPYAFGLVLLMCVACAVFGTVLNHLVFGKALR